MFISYVLDILAPPRARSQSAPACTLSLRKARAPARGGSDLRAIFRRRHHELAIESLPALPRQSKGRYGLIDGKKMFGPDLTIGTDIFELPGIGRARGGLMVVGPDRCIAHGPPPHTHKVPAKLLPSSC
jgi:hypothetical protein